MKWIEVIVVSALPVSELRGGIPLAIYYGFDPLHAYLIGVAGNLIPVPFLLLFLNLIEEKILKKWSITSPLYLKIEKKVLNRKKLIDKYGYFGLLLFVAIPFPATGAWTGCLLATSLKMDFKKSILFISLGVFVAGMIVVSAVNGILSFLSFLIR